jgi:hypothetical protein
MSDGRDFHLRIAEPRSDAHLVEVRAALVKLPDQGFLEIWIDHSPYPSLCALVNGERGWLMCLRFDGDAGFSSRNPRYVGPPDAQIEYRLSNGQVDSFPAAWAYPRTDVFGALEYFARHRRVPETIEWFNHAGDGKSSPNEDL